MLHPIAVSQLPVDLRVKVGECVTNVAVEFTYARFVGRHVLLRCVVNKVVREQFFEHVEVPLSLDFFGISTDNSLCGIG